MTLRTKTIPKDVLGYAGYLKGLIQIQMSDSIKTFGPGLKNYTANRIQTAKVFFLLT